MPDYYGTSPLGSALSAISQQLMLREQMKRQAQLDQIAQEQQQQTASRQTQELALRQAQEARIAEMQRRAMEQDEQQARAAQSQQANASGMRQMIADAAGMGPLTPDRARDISLMGYREGVPVPGIVDQAMAPPKPRATTALGRGAVLVDETTGEQIASGLPPEADEGNWSSAGGGVLYNTKTGQTRRLPGGGGAEDGGTQAAGEQYATERRTRIRDAVTELLPQVAGNVGAKSYLAGVRGTPQRDFKAALDYLKSNIGFSELTEMRQASKTGGALGQVSNIELQLLTSALGSLDIGQGEAAFNKQLQNIVSSLDRWETAKAQYGGAGSGSSGGPGPATGVQRWGRDANGRPVRMP